MNNLLYEMYYEKESKPPDWQKDKNKGDIIWQNDRNMNQTEINKIYKRVNEIDKSDNKSQSERKIRKKERKSKS